MKKVFASLVGASLVSLIAACGGGAAGPAVPDTPEGAAFTFRTSLMETIAWKMALLLLPRIRRSI